MRRRFWAVTAGLLLIFAGCAFSKQTYGHPLARIRTTTTTAAAPGTVYYRDRVVVLMFHAFGNTPQGDTITPDVFAADLEALRGDGFQVITPAMLESFLSGRGTVPPNAVLLTFDDGYASVYQYTYPLLVRYQDPALMFLVAGWVGNRPDIMTWDQVRVMAGSKLVTFGSHTYNSHGAVAVNPLAQLPDTVAYAYNWQTGKSETQNAYQARVLADLRLAQDTFKANLGMTTPYFAYPFGVYDQALISLLHQAGNRYLFTTLGGPNVPGEAQSAIFRLNVGTANVTPAGMAAAVIDIGRGGFAPAPSWWCQRWCQGALAGELGLAIPLPVSQTPLAAPVYSKVYTAVYKDVYAK